MFKTTRPFFYHYTVLVPRPPTDPAPRSAAIPGSVDARSSCCSTSPGPRSSSRLKPKPKPKLRLRRSLCHQRRQLQSRAPFPRRKFSDWKRRPWHRWELEGVLGGLKGCSEAPEFVSESVGRMSSQQRQAGGLAASVSSGRAVLGQAKHKNWRANYLRALNIYTPDVDLARARVLVDPRGRSRPAGNPNSGALAASSGRRSLLRANGEDSARRSMASDKSSSSGNRSAVSRLLGRRSSMASSSNNNSHSQVSASPEEHKGSYVFGMRSHLFRARRPAADMLVVDRVSAPIEIPTAQTPTQHTPVASERRGSTAKSPIAIDGDNQASTNRQQLLSWEEPSVMMGSNGWPLEIDKPGRRPDKHRPTGFDSSDLPFVIGRRPPTYPTQHSAHRDGSEFSTSRLDPTPLGRHCRVGIPEEDCDETEDDETEDLDRADNSRDDQEDESEDEDDIFKMDGLEDSTRPKLKKKSSFRTFDGGESRASYSSMGAGRRRGSLPTPGSAMRGGNQDDADEYRTLSESFVPPHQMVERDCFSLGLRDELKRRPLRT